MITSCFLRDIGDMRASAGGTVEFGGPKSDALFRFMKRGDELGKMVVLVFPLSPKYQEQFVTKDVLKRFNDLLSEAQKKSPKTIWIRLDASPELQSNELYWDLVHLNAPGQAIASKLLREQLTVAGIR